MSNEMAISVRNLGKAYTIVHNQERHNTLAEAALHRLRRPLRRYKKEIFWALNDVSFSIKLGEVVGIIGRNGAGKSTLLKILSRITEPTTGIIDLYGRVGSLLEVGTGFHPELTGRENIYLNGHILGMRKKEINKKFDAIIDFAGIQQFLDTPVKRYSSGMYVRLAFAVAAHLDPEILIVDEVLAVGDREFQQKCLGTMQSVAKSGRTVVIVSHDLSLIESFCDRAILLSAGHVDTTGMASEVVSQYISSFQPGTGTHLLDYPRQGRNSAARFSSISIENESGAVCREVKVGGGIVISLGIQADSPIRKPWVGVRITTALNQLIHHVANREAGYELPPVCGECTVSCRIESLNLLPGRYYISLILADAMGARLDELSAVTYFDVLKGDPLGTGVALGPEYGLVFFESRWDVVANSHLSETPVTAQLR